MNEERKYKLKHILRMALWSSAGVVLFVLLLSAMHRNSRLVCSGTDVLIEGYNHEMFISEAEVKKMLEAELAHKIEGNTLEQLDLRKLERSLQKNPWISKAQLFVDNQQLLHVSIAERMPVARVFTRSGQSFYMDSSAVVLPLSVNEIADVPVFTNVPDQSATMNTTDSLVWKQISRMGNFIKQDPFLLMQLGQIDIVSNAAYKMYPAIGNHVIEFGTADQYQQKLQRLSVFYKRIFGKVGLNKYEVVDLRYDKQIVAALRGKQESNIDPVAAMQKFEELVSRTVLEANDTTVRIGSEKIEKTRHEILIPTSLEPVSITDNEKVIERVQQEQPKQEQPKIQTAKKSQSEQVIVKEKSKQNQITVITQKQKPMVKQPAHKPKPSLLKSKPKPVATDNKQPRAVMPKQNDY